MALAAAVAATIYLLLISLLKCMMKKAMSQHLLCFHCVMAVVLPAGMMGIAIVIIVVA